MNVLRPELQKDASTVEALNSYERADDNELLGLWVLHDDKNCLAELVRRHYQAVRGIINRKLSCPDDVEDALQSTFLVLAQSAHRIRKRNSLSSWLYGVALRICSRIIEKSKKGAQSNLPGDLEKTEANEESPFLNVARKMQLDVLDQELSGVRRAYRDVLIEHYMGGRTAAEIAEQFNVSQATIEGRLRRGRAELRAKLLRRGYSFTAILSLLSAIKVSESASIPSAAVNFIVNQILEPKSNSASVQALAREEITMSAYLTTKASVMATTTCAVFIIGVLAVNLHGNQEGEGDGAGGSDVTTFIAAKSPVNSAPVAMQAAEPDSQSDFEEPSATAAKVSTVAIPKWAEKPPSNLPQRLGTIEIEPDYHDIPLEHLFAALSDDLNIPIWIDEPGLEENGVTADHPIRMQLPPIPFPQALRMICAQFDGGYYLDDDVIVVTSKRCANENPRMEVYDLSSLSDSQAELRDIQSLVTLSIQKIEPELWEDNTWQAGVLSDSIILNTSDIVHRKFAKDLTKLAHQLGRFTVPAISANKPGARSRNSGGNSSGGRNSNPFGNKPRASSDPFGGGGNAASDPFGSSEDASDPFGGGSQKSDSGPFGDNDPFGG